MNEIIKPHSFEDAKQHIQTFVDETPSNLELSTVSNEGGLFGLFNHKVTGNELNKVTSQIQNYLIAFNKLNSMFIDEFGQVYKALESLDSEYIPAILSSIKGAEIASNQAKAAQDDITKTIAAQKKIIKVLENHKDKLDRLKHLTNIDEIWNDSQKLKQDLKAFKSNFERAQEQVAQLDVSIKSVQRYADSLLDYEHLDEIDDIWERVGQSEKDISECYTLVENLQTEISFCSNSIIEIKSTIDRVNQYKHFKDIDIIWEDVEKAKDVVENICQSQKKILLDISCLQDMSAGFAEFENSVKKQTNWNNIDMLWEEMREGKKSIEKNNNDIKEADNEIKLSLKRIKAIENYVDKLNSQVHTFQVDELWGENEKLANEVTGLAIKLYDSGVDLQTLKEKNKEEKKDFEMVVDKLKRQIKTVFYIAVGAIGIAIMELILNVIGII